MKKAAWILLMVVTGGYVGMKITPPPFETGFEHFSATFGYFLGMGAGSALLAAFITAIPAAIARKRSGAWPDWYMSASLVVLIILLLANGASNRFIEERETYSEPSSATPKSVNPAGELRTEFQEFSQNAIKTLGNQETAEYSDRELVERMTQLLQRLFKEVQAQRNQYLSGLDKLGWNQILEPNRLLQDRRNGMAESQQMIREARALILRQRDRIYDLIESYSKQTKELMRTPSERNAFEEGLEQSLQSSEKAWALELSIVDTVEAIVALFANDPEWEYKNGMYYFSNDRYANQFNELRAELDETINTQEQYMTDSADSIDQFLEVLEDELQ